MTEALLITYRPSADQTELPAATGSMLTARIAGRVRRAQLGNERMKYVRWRFETDLAATLAGGPVTRNSLINKPGITLNERNPDRTDILHKYFVLPERFPEFLNLCRDVIPGSYQEFLNVTLRFANTDPTAGLPMPPYRASPR